MQQPPIPPRPLPPKAAEILAAVEAKRGYLLPYHRMFAASAPALLEQYDAFYEQLTLVPRVLSPVERETVWAGLLAAAREVHGFIHMKRAVKAGLTEADIVRAVAIASATEGYATMSFSGENWAAWTLPAALERTYLAMVAAVSGDLSPKLRISPRWCAMPQDATGAAWSSIFGWQWNQGPRPPKSAKA